ncbi:hypothetical protein [Streptomyces mirabilis]|uniref:hypothetical protein n=1 Tax=Streptomyces mirabilis TaxID=68239 RepID=UPI0033346047
MARSLPKLYYIAVSLSSLKALRALAEAALGPDAWIPPLDVAVVSDFRPHKLRALAAHAGRADAAALLQLFGLPAGSRNTYGPTRRGPAAHGRATCLALIGAQSCRPTP